MIDVQLNTLIPLFFLILFTIFARLFSRSWFEPGVFFSLIWLFYTGLPILLAPNYYVWSGGVWWIFFSVFSLYVGSAIVIRYQEIKNYLKGNLSINKTSIEKKINLSLPGLRSLIIVSIFFGLLYSLIIIREQGENIALFFSLERIAKFANIRYFGNFIPSLLSQVFLVGAYLAPILGGLLFANRKSKIDLFWSIFSLIPSFVIFLLHSTRFAVLVAGILWLSSYLALKIFLTRGRLSLFSRKNILTILLILIFLPLLFSIGQALRRREVPTVQSLFKILSSASWRASVFGHLSVFSQWLKDFYSFPTLPTFGTKSLAGLFNLLGLSQRQPGLYEYSYEVEPGGWTNIYTIFRQLIEDFTLPGSLLVLFIIGIIASWAYVNLVRGRIYSLPILVAFFSFTLLFIVNIFTNNSILFAWLILVLYFELVKLSNRIKCPTKK